MLAHILERLPSMVAYWDVDQRCVFANRAYERWFGVSPESLRGTHVRELLGPMYALNRPYIEAALRGEPQQFERVVPDRAGGPSRDALITYIPDLVEGTVRGLIVHVVDVSDLKRSQLAVAESEARLAAIIAMSSDAIVAVDADQQIMLFNHAAEAIYGYLPQEILGRPLDVLVPARLRPLPRGQEHALASIGVRKNGDEFPAESLVSNVDVDGTTLLTVVVRDVTERHALEAEQRLLAEAGIVLAGSLEVKRTLRAIAQLAADRLGDVCVVDLLVDGGVERLTIAHSDPALESACERLAALTLERRDLLSATVLETRTPAIYDLTPEEAAAMTQDLAHRAVLLDLGLHASMVVPLATPTKLLGTLVISSRTPGRYTNRELRVATELARRATLAIENAQLYEAARRATQSRDEVLGIVAHDVRSPLNAIALATKTLERTAESPRARQAIDQIRSSIARANRLIADLLDVRRIEGGALSIERRPVASAALVADAVEASQLAASAASIDLAGDVTAALPGIHADRVRLLQVFDNLIGNALKFTPAGGRITVGASTHGEDVVFFVRDTGAGIASESLAHVFDRFWQGGHKRGDGAGLGLAICQGIVEAHAGKIWLESTPGAGSTFLFSIRAAHA